ncbi:hypothetical protein ACHAWF_012090 [Thalassiosira exigua]
MIDESSTGNVPLLEDNPSVKNEPSLARTATISMKHFFRKRIKQHWKIKVARLALFIWPLVRSFKPGHTNDWSDLNTYMKLLSRMCAYALYPDLVLVFLTKCRALESFLDRTPLSLYTECDSHRLHKYNGRWIFYFCWFHVLFQLISWGITNKMDHLWAGQTGKTGLVMIACLPVISIPMLFRYFRVKFPYELRKALHYIFVVFVLALIFHVKSNKLPWAGWNAVVMGTVFCIYLLDVAIVWLCMSVKVETTHFQVLPSSGVQLTAKVPKSFCQGRQHGGFAFVCLPWIDKNQWHAYSLYETSRSDEKAVFIMKNGDWTEKVYQQLQRNTHRPAWFQGPFTSPYGQADTYDNHILVAGGIGITPALSAMSNFHKTRHVNLIWVVRDQNMLEFFIQRLRSVSDVNIFIYYTGSAPLNPAYSFEEGLTGNVKLLTGRPPFDSLVPNIIYMTEKEVKMPVVTDCTNHFVLDSVINKMTEFEGAGATDDEILLAVADLAYTHGVQLKVLLEQMAIYYNESIPSNENPLELVRALRSAENENKITRGSIRRSATRSSKSWQQYQPWEEQDGSKSFVKALDKELVLSSWGVLFCGGSKGIQDKLTSICKEYAIDFSSESFEW